MLDSATSGVGSLLPCVLLFVVVVKTHFESDTEADGGSVHDSTGLRALVAHGSCSCCVRLAQWKLFAGMCMACGNVVRMTVHG